MRRGGKGRGRGNATGTQKVGAGRLRGRKLLALPPELEQVRPTGSRVRSAIYDRLQAEVVGARVLDLFAGTGALAIEAVSRGAASAVCVEKSAPVVAFLRQQVAGLGVDGEIEVVRADAVDFLADGGRSPARSQFSLVLVDPPYADGELYCSVLAALGGWLQPDAVVVCELMPAAVPGLVWPRGFRLEARREHGQTALDFLRYEGPDAP